jgi:parallel beta-helix repeat protein
MKGMKKKTVLAVFALAFLTLLPYLAIKSTVSQSYSQAVISIEPPEIHKQVSENFEINVTVANVTNLQGFSFTLYYHPKILTCLKWDANGSMLNASSKQYYVESGMDSVFVDLPVSSETDPRNGSGTLVTITFQCMQAGEGIFDLEPVFGGNFLTNSTRKPIPCEKRGGRYVVDELSKEVPIYGDYSLCVDINFSELHLFSIEADNIVLDLNGHTINNIARSIDRTGYGHAIEVYDKNNVTIKNGVITNFQYGIEIIRCGQNGWVNISNITVLHSIDYAMRIEQSSNVRIHNCSGQRDEGECLSLSNSSFCEVSHNVLSNNMAYGIEMANSASNNTICYNKMLDNYDSGGISISGSSKNYIFQNDFINNTDRYGNRNHVKIDQKSTNLWNSSYPYGGNYWDDWNDTARQIVDNKSGENHRIPGPDGIGDTAYVINDKNGDKYPLTNPCGSKLRVFDIHKVLLSPTRRIQETRVAVFTNSSATDFNFSGKLGLISFNVNGSTFCKVIVSCTLLDGAFEVKVDGRPVASFLNWEGDYLFVNFTHSIESHQVEIQGEIARRCDVNGDGKVNIQDIAAVAREYAFEYTYEIIEQKD